MAISDPFPDAVVDSLQLSDLVAVEELERASFSTPWPRVSFELALRESHCVNLAVRVQHQLAGYLVAILQPPALLIANLAIEPGFRRRQLATLLVQSAFESGRSNDCSYAVLDVRPSNRAARSTYEALGFEEVGRRQDYYQNPPEDSLTMARPL